MSESLPKAQRYANRRVLLVLSLSVSVLVMRDVWSIGRSNYEFKLYPSVQFTNSDDGQNTHPPCYHLPGAEEVLVVMKTTATKTQKNIPIHLSTTFQCVPNFIIYSDLEESILEQPIYDVLQVYDNATRQANDDFRVYDMIQHSKRGGDQDLLSSAWVLSMLDRWKYIPMLTQSLRHSPSSKWFVFIDSDTYLVWSSLLSFLQKFDPSKPVFLGNKLYLDGMEFASGGSGVILSNAALRQFSQYHQKSDAEEFLNLTRAHGEGDVVMSLGLNRSGVVLDHVWPNLQGETPESLDYTAKHWCFSPVTYHGMSITQIKSMWDFEQSFTGKESPLSPLLHRDVYEQFVAPFILIDQHDWDNQCTETVDDIQEESSLGCWAACMDMEGCVQWWYSEWEYECKISKDLRFGKRSDCGGGNCVAGWIGERVDALKREMGDCETISYHGFRDIGA